MGWISTGFIYIYAEDRKGLVPHGSQVLFSYYRVCKLNTPGGVVGSVKSYALTPSQIPPHHPPNGLRCLDLHGIGGVRVGAQGEAGIATHLYFLPKAEPEERNRRPGGSFPLVSKYLNVVVNLSRSDAACP